VVWPGIPRGADTEGNSQRVRVHRAREHALHFCYRAFALRRQLSYCFVRSNPGRKGSIRDGGNWPHEEIMKRTASAIWQGDLKSGKGTISTASGVLSNTQYSFSARFEQGTGTNPEELIAAAHAGCFAMALSAQLGEAGLVAQRIDASATVTLEKTDGGFAVTSSHLQVTVKVPGGDRARIETAANNAKAGCPISKLLNAKITMDAKYET
jgi:osmotically inducible protein OsmC